MKGQKGFWENVEKSDGCWEWKGAYSESGYGRYGRHWQAHRISWELTFGPIPRLALVSHKCCNRMCVRPEHLYLTDHKTVNAVPPNKKNLNEAEMVNLYVQEQMSTPMLAKLYKVSSSVIGMRLRKYGVMRSRSHAAMGQGPWNRMDNYRSIRNGYVYIRLDPDDPHRGMANKVGYVLFHRIVMARHLGRNLTKNEVVHHSNGDKLNNELENLSLHHSHSDHMRIHGKSSAERLPLTRGESHPNSKLKESDITTIRTLYDSKMLTPCEIARRYLVSQGTIWKIVRRENWRHVI